MIKILHAADLHLGSRFQGLDPELAVQRRKQLLEVPDRLADLCLERDCQLLFLAGDLFDRPEGDRAGAERLAAALERAGVPTFLTPGNHDPYGAGSPYQSFPWPGNVHIFTQPSVSSVALPELSCRVWGAGFQSMDCPGLLEGFRAAGPEAVQLAVLHGDPARGDSPCCPVTRAQVVDSGLAYLALGHLHKAGQFQAGRTLCAWPGCPMGRGFDETGVKGVYVTEVDRDGARAEFVPLDGGRYEDLTVEVGPAPLESILAALPPDAARDIYRITLTGTAAEVDLEALTARLKDRFFSLRLRDRTTPPEDLWERADRDSLEGLYFRLLREAMTGADERTREVLTLAARLSRRILDGREVDLP